MAAAGAAFAGQLQIHCLNVGQGDAALVISPSGRRLLVDAGYDSLGTKKVLSWLAGLGIRSLDWIVATHYHADHIGGLDEVIAGLGLDSVREAVLDRGWSYSTTHYDDYVRAAGGKRRTIADGRVLDLGGGATATCRAVNGNGRLTQPFTDPPYSENDMCVALVISFERFDFSISGDLSGQTTAYYRDIETSLAPEVGPVEVLRVNHHGSEYSSNQYFVSTLAPLASVVSCGANDYGHPNSGVISRLRAFGAVYQTADRRGRPVDGDIVITTDGTSFAINGDSFICRAGIGSRPETGPGAAFPQGPVRAPLVIRGTPCRSGRFFLDAYDLTGSLVGAAVSGPDGTLAWDCSDQAGRPLEPGVYFVVLRTGSGPACHKLVLLR